MANKMIIFLTVSLVETVTQCMNLVESEKNDNLLRVFLLHGVLRESEIDFCGSKLIVWQLNLVYTPNSVPIFVSLLQNIYRVMY